MNNLKIHAVKDKKEKIYKKKGILPDLPFRLLAVGKSYLAGKTNFITNLLLKDEFYKNDFNGEYIYIISPSISTDNKLKTIIRQFDIPDSNLFDDYDPQILEELYDFIKDDYNEKLNDNEKIPYYLIYFDDISFSGKLKGSQSKIFNKFFCNSRHFNASIISTTQKLSDISTTARENCSCAILFNLATKKEMELMELSFNHLQTKKAFINMYLDNTKEKHSFIIVNYSNDYNKMYLNKDFKPIDTNKFLK